MKNYKVLVVDFDGTLVTSDFNLSSKVEDSIKKISQDFKFCIATGRPFHGIVKKVCKKLNLTNPQIASGGAEIIDPKTDKVLWAEYFPKETAKSLVSYFLKNKFEFGVESEGFALTPRNTERSEYGPNMIYKRFEDLNYGKISKIVLFHVASIGDPQEVEKNLQKKYQELHFIRGGKNGSPMVLDITSVKANKHLAVLELSKLLKVDIDLMIGIGDGYNDYPLLSVCGYKVAMENAPDELKAIADLIVPSVENDGLLSVINRLNR